MVRLLVSALLVLGVAACGRSPGQTNSQGRYAGIGIYSAGEMWDQLARGNSPKDDAAATLDDDDQVIVVVDSHTGEVRQCGNLSGYCVKMNPWSASLTATQNAPVAVSKHAADLAAARADATDAEGEAAKK